MARPPKEFELNKRYDRLVYLGNDFFDDRGRRFAHFDCDCGNKDVVLRLSPVIAGKVGSCGCKRGGMKYFTLIPEEEKQLIRELSPTHSIKQLTLKFKHDRVTIHKILGIEKQKKEPKEGFFDYDAYVKSDFILQG